MPAVPVREFPKEGNTWAKVPQVHKRNRQVSRRFTAQNKEESTVFV